MARPAPFRPSGANSSCQEQREGVAEGGHPGLSILNSRWRKRRGSNPHLQNLPSGHSRVPILDFRMGSSTFPRWPSSRDVATPSRYRGRARRLTVEQESAIRSLAGTRSLRSLAVDFGVSHETIRAVVRQERSETR